MMIPVNLHRQAQQEGDDDKQNDASLTLGENPPAHALFTAQLVAVAHRRFSTRSRVYSRSQHTRAVTAFDIPIIVLSFGFSRYEVAVSVRWNIEVTVDRAVAKLDLHNMQLFAII